MDYKEVKDSGKREEYDSGARRDTRAGKGRYDLVPPVALKRVAKHYENGAVKYGDNNWRLGIPSSRFMDSLLRHANRYLDGERDEDHLAAVIFNAMAIIYNEERNTEYHDLEKKE